MNKRTYDLLKELCRLANGVGQFPYLGSFGSGSSMEAELQARWRERLSQLSQSDMGDIVDLSVRVSQSLIDTTEWLLAEATLEFNGAGLRALGLAKSAGHVSASELAQVHEISPNQAALILAKLYAAGAFTIHDEKFELSDLGQSYVSNMESKIGMNIND